MDIFDKNNNNKTIIVNTFKQIHLDRPRSVDGLSW